MEPTLITAIISSCVAACSLVVAILSFALNKNKDTRQSGATEIKKAEARGEERGVLNAKLDNITLGITSLQTSLKALSDSVNEMNTWRATAQEKLITLQREMHDVRVKLGMTESEYRSRSDGQN